MLPSPSKNPAMYARVASCTVLGLPSVLPSARSVSNAGGVSPIQPVCILKLLSGDAVILRSEPSSRAALMGEQPNPWDLSLPPLLVGQDYTFTMARSCHHDGFRCEPCDRCPIDYLTYLTEAAKRCCRGSVVTGDESLDHCRRILTPSSRSDVQTGQCICPVGLCLLDFGS